MNPLVLYRLPIFASVLCITIQGTVNGQTLAGIDVLVKNQFVNLTGRRVGLITNQTGVNAAGESTVTLLADAENVDLVALFSPEHGFAGQLDQSEISDSEDQSTGIKIHSLYGKTRVPTKEMVHGIDTLVFDIQDIGTRFYTYISTMGGAMRAASKYGLRFVVLDRPNPINGVTVSGPVLDAGGESFVGYHTLAVRHGMTTGELAEMFRSEWDIDIELEIIPMQNWNPKLMFDSTGRLWVNPSPNMRCLTQAILYPGVGLLETTNLSVGRGTDTPFEVLGAPWIHPTKFAQALNQKNLPGVVFVPVKFQPDSSKYEGEICGGVNIVITNRDRFDATDCGWLLARTLRVMYEKEWETQSLNRLLVDEVTKNAILATQSVDSIKSGYAKELQEFRQRREAFLLYPR